MNEWERIVVSDDARRRRRAMNLGGREGEGRRRGGGSRRFSRETRETFRREGSQTRGSRNQPSFFSRPSARSRRGAAGASAARRALAPPVSPAGDGGVASTRRRDAPDAFATPRARPRGAGRRRNARRDVGDGATATPPARVDRERSRRPSRGFPRPAPRAVPGASATLVRGRAGRGIARARRTLGGRMPPKPCMVADDWSFGGDERARDHAGAAISKIAARRRAVACAVGRGEAEVRSRGVRALEACGGGA